MIASLVIALSTFTPLAFGHEIRLQDRGERTVLRIEHEWLRVLVERDLTTLERILADDLMDSSWKGELRTKSQLLEGLSKPLPYSQYLQNIKIKFYASVALARGLNEISDKNGRIVMRIRFTDVLLYRHGY
ncbi:MAG: hypothetical protein DME99_03090 [Verrucomicrobia bacterium]|nr:MAG: hypothetical protein DME99_03090 [Verrucomicrobiota bacterium]